MVIDENVDPELVTQVVACYGSNLDDEQLSIVGRDPILIAYALRFRAQRSVVTTEVSKPKRIGANRHIPDVCTDVDVLCCNTFEFIRRLDFRTDWNSPRRKE